MYIAERYKWMRPYYRASVEYISKYRLAKVKSIKATGISDNKNVHQHAALINQGDDTFTIVINPYYRRGVIKNGKKRFEYHWFSKIDLLGLLAHEVAHLVHWDHTPDHAALEGQLRQLYMKMLGDSGYISEEVEVLMDDRGPPR